MSSQKISKDLFKIIVPSKVAWGEMDAFQHVNNSVYFKYFEIARIKFMEDSGMLKQMKEEHIGPILAKIDCNFLKPLTYPDNIEIGVRVLSIGNSSYVLQHAVFSEKIGLAAVGNGVVVMLNYADNSKWQLNDQMKATLEKHL